MAKYGRSTSVSVIWWQTAADRLRRLYAASSRPKGQEQGVHPEQGEEEQAKEPDERAAGGPLGGKAVPMYGSFETNGKPAFMSVVWREAKPQMIELCRAAIGCCWTR